MNKTNKEILEAFDKKFPVIQNIPTHKCEGWNDDDDLEEGTMIFDWSEVKSWLSSVLEKKDAEIEEASKICKNCGRKLVKQIEAKLSKEKEDCQCWFDPDYGNMHNPCPKHDTPPPKPSCLCMRAPDDVLVEIMPNCPFHCTPPPKSSECQHNFIGMYPDMKLTCTICGIAQPQDKPSECKMNGTQVPLPCKDCEKGKCNKDIYEDGLCFDCWKFAQPKEKPSECYQHSVKFLDDDMREKHMEEYHGEKSSEDLFTKLAELDEAQGFRLSTADLDELVVFISNLLLQSKQQTLEEVRKLLKYGTEELVADDGTHYKVFAVNTLLNILDDLKK